MERIRKKRGVKFKWNGREGYISVAGIVVIEGEIYLVRRFNCDIVELLPFNDFYNWQLRGYPKKSVPPWLMLCRKNGEWTNSPYPPAVLGNELVIEDPHTIVRLNRIAKLT